MGQKKHLWQLLAALLTVLFIGYAANTSQAQGTNLLQNPSFEQPYNSDGAAGNWVRWHRESSPDLFGDCTNGYHKRPRWGNATDIVLDGSTSQFVGNNWDTWAGGVWQTVNVTPGARYRFSFWAYGYGSMAAGDPSYAGLNMNIRAGIDPNGSGLWSDSDVVWSAPGNAHDNWVQFVVETTATGDKVTVFTAADWGVQGVNQCYKFLNVYFDKAELVELGPPPTNTPLPPPPATNTPLPPPPTPTPANTPTPTATPVPTATFTPTPIPGATVCINAFADDNANGLHDSNEGFMAGVTFTISSAAGFSEQGISPGNAAGVCFEGLPTGTYDIVEEVPARLEMTTANSAQLPVEEGKTYNVEFGSRLNTGSSQPDAVANVTVPPATEPTAVSNTPAPANNTPSLRTGAIIGLAAAGLGVIMLGGLLFYVLRRS